MALQTIGLSTHRWNNHIKSVLLFALYPIIIGGTYLAIIIAICAAFNLLETNGSYIFDTYKVVRNALKFIWLPYILIFLYLVLLFICRRNALHRFTSAHLVTRRNNPKIYGLLEKLCLQCHLPMPKLFIEEQPLCDVYSLGLTPATYTIVLTDKLVWHMNDQQIESMLAHQLIELHNGDARLRFLIDALTDIFGTLSEVALPLKHLQKEDSNLNPIHAMLLEFPFLAFVLLLIAITLKCGSIFSVVLKLLLSRTQYIIADMTAIGVTQNPEAMISALQILYNENEKMRTTELLTHTFLYSQEKHDDLLRRIAGIVKYTHTTYF